MRVVVKGKNIDVTPALREHAEKRLAKIAKFFTDGSPVTVDVVLSVQRDMHIAEVTLQVRSIFVRGESKTEDMYASIDASVDRVERQVRRHKKRLQARAQDSVKLGELHAEAQGAGAVAESEPQLVRTKRFAVKPMDVEEALLQMELLGHDFFVFRNAENEEVSVVYKRRDGNFGLIEPETT